MTGHTLASVLEAILLAEHCEADNGTLSYAESQRVRRIIAGALEIGDLPSSREPYEVARIVGLYAEGASRDAANRYLGALSAEEVASLRLPDVLGLLAPGLYKDVNELADEAEENRRGQLGVGAPDV